MNVKHIMFIFPINKFYAFGGVTVLGGYLTFAMVISEGTDMGMRWMGKCDNREWRQYERKLGNDRRRITPY